MWRGIEPHSLSVIGPIRQTTYTNQRQKIYIAVDRCLTGTKCDLSALDCVWEVTSVHAAGINFTSTPLSCYPSCAAKETHISRSFVYPTDQREANALSLSNPLRFKPAASLSFMGNGITYTGTYVCVLGVSARTEISLFIVYFESRGRSLLKVR